MNGLQLNCSVFTVYSFGYKLGRGNWTSFPFKLCDPNSLWTIHVHVTCALFWSLFISMAPSHLLCYHLFPLSCFLQDQLCPLLCMVPYPQRSEVCRSFPANLPCSHHHASQRGQSVSGWLALLWIHNKPRHLPRSHTAPGAKMSGVTSCFETNVHCCCGLILGSSSGPHSHPPSVARVREIRMVKVRKLLGWDKKSLTPKAKAVWTSKAKQGSHPLSLINRQVFAIPPEKQGSTKQSCYFRRRNSQHPSFFP